MVRDGEIAEDDRRFAVDVANVDFWIRSSVDSNLLREITDQQMFKKIGTVAFVCNEV